MNKHKSNKIKENSNTVRHLIMGQIITTQNLVATKVVRLAGQSTPEWPFNGGGGGGGVHMGHMNLAIWVALFCNIVPYVSNYYVWNWSNTMNISSALWILTWCFSTRASVATMLRTYSGVFSWLWVKHWDLNKMVYFILHLQSHTIWSLLKICIPSPPSH